MSKYNKNRNGTRLNDGKEAHAADHATWSRRQFLSRSGVTALGGSLFGMSPLALTSPLISSLYDNPDNDRVLILIRLDGGNDGLNTIVPYGNNMRRTRYESLRSNSNKISQLDLNPLMIGNQPSEFALRKIMGKDNGETGIYKMWQDGNMGVIHNVGYPNSSRSHFLGGDLWSTGAIEKAYSEIESAIVTVDDPRRYLGWMGRYFNQTLPAFLDAPPTVPPAIQIGTSNSLVFRGAGGTPFDLVFQNTDAFDALIDSGELYNTSGYDTACIADIERIFVRRLTNNTFRYAGSVQNASDAGKNQVSYLNGLGKKMEIVARLIKGQLKTKVYLVELGGFDTHSAQEARHIALMEELSNAIRSTYEDLSKTGDQDRVMMMTFSEFGRSVIDNQGGGTDHGTLAPIMLFGGGVNGQNFYGTPIDLGADSNTDKIVNGRVDFDTQGGAIDFKSVYDKVLRDWLCADAQTSDNVLNYATRENIDAPPKPYIPCNELAPEGTGAECADPMGAMILGGCNTSVSQSAVSNSYIDSQIILGYNISKEGDDTFIEFKYATKSPANVRLQILDETGKERTYTYTNPITGMDEDGDLNLINQYRPTGSYTHRLNLTELVASDIEQNPQDVVLVAGTRYLCRLEANGLSVEKNFIIHEF